jgi:tetratricopeptide (TPR) repeat protein
MSSPTVFVSYSQDNQAHNDRVLALSDRLMAEGIDCALDQYETSPPEGWPNWMEKHIRKSDFIIIVCTETYCRRANGEEVTGKGRGVKWESTLTFNQIYQADSQNTRFIPILFDPDDAEYIPSILQVATYYCVNTEEGYEKLYRRLTNQPIKQKPELGILKKLPSKERKSDFLKAQAINVSLAKMPTTNPDVFGREKELAILDEAWESEHTNIVMLVAFGGVGKTALVNKWLINMELDNFRGAERVLGWTFYSQGSRQDGQASADQFIASALRWFGDPNPDEGSPWNKGERLAQLVRKEKTLLVLDGLEPLQNPADCRLRDQSLQSLLKELSRQNPGLCVITTRISVEDIKANINTSVEEIKLENLSPEAGAELLEKLGAKGLPDELKQAVCDLKGHALAVTLLGTYLRIVRHGDIRMRKEIPKLMAETKLGEHARHIMESYEKWFIGKPELNILYIMGLFDRSAEGGAIQALKKEPVIKGLTDQLLKLSQEKWQFALDNLRTARLLADEDTHAPDTLDCHPLIREHFGEKLKNNPKAWKEAHSRLYEWYKSQAKELPDTIEEMNPLYSAVIHGCQAGRYKEAYDEVYMRRITRGNEDFNSRKLGAYGSDLSVLSGFFEIPWSKPVDVLTEDDKAYVLNATGFCLRALGRLTESAELMKAGLEAIKARKDWKNAAIQASNFSELYLIMGEIDNAVDYARQSVDLADQSRDAFWRMAIRTTLADALHQSGILKEAEDTFKKAEEIQKKRQSRSPLLFSLWGVRYCDFLLGQGNYGEVMERASQTQEYEKEGWYSLLDIALDHLSLGCAYMLKAQMENGDFSKAVEYLDQAVNGLRQSRRPDVLPRGLLARASLRRIRMDFDDAKRDVDEAFAIADRGGMGLYLSDCHLEYARLYLVMGKKDEAKANLTTAKDMITRIGYHRRDNEVQELEKQLSDIG